MAAASDLLVASSIKRKDGVIVAGRLNLSGTWVKRLAGSKKDVSWLAPLASLRKLKLTSHSLVLDDKICEALTFSGHLHQLEELEGLPRRWLARLARSKKPWALRRIKLFPGDQNDRKERAALDAAFAKGKGLPALADLALTWSEFGPEAYGWLMTTPTGRGLKVLRINYLKFSKPLVAWKQAIESAGDDVALEEIEMYTGSTTVSLHRTPKGWRLSGDMTEDAKAHHGLGARELAAAVPMLGLAEVDVKGWTG